MGRLPIYTSNLTNPRARLARLARRYDSADIDSAVEGVVNGIWFNQGQVCCAGSRLLVQQSVAEKFLDKLKLRMR